MKRFFEVGLNILMVATCLSVLAVNLGFRSASRQSGTADERFRQGEELKGVAVDLTATPRTAIVFVHSTCRYCASSMEFYKALVARPEHQSRHFRLILAGIEDETKLRQFARDFDLSPDGVTSVVSSDARARSTPTFVVVNDKGVVLQVWVGQQPAQGQDEILRAMLKM